MNEFMQRLINRIMPADRGAAGRAAPHAGANAGPRAGANDALSDALAAALSSGSSDWSPTHYAGYFAASAPVYAALRLRADAVARPRLLVYRESAVGGERSRAWVGPQHPAQTLLDRVNPHWTGGDLWRATEIYLNLWGVAYWSVMRDEMGAPTEIWPLRPDRVRLVPDDREYIRGYLYTGASGAQVAFAADEIVRLRYFNPLDEYAGLSPIAPARLTLDMGRDALVGNRSGLANDGAPGVALETGGPTSEDEVRRIYEQWEARYRGPRNRLRPLVLSEGMKISHLGFSPRDMEYVRALRWTVEDVARVFNVPKPMLHDLERAYLLQHRDRPPHVLGDVHRPRTALLRREAERDPLAHVRRPVPDRRVRHLQHRSPPRVRVRTRPPDADLRLSRHNDGRGSPRPARPARGVGPLPNRPRAPLCDTLPPSRWTTRRRKRNSQQEQAGETHGQGHRKLSHIADAQGGRGGYPVLPHGRPQLRHRNGG